MRRIRFLRPRQVLDQQPNEKAGSRWSNWKGDPQITLQNAENQTWLTVIPIHSALIVDIQRNFVQRSLLIDRIHDRFLTSGMSQSKRVANLVHEDVGKSNTAFLSGIVQDPRLVIVKMDVTVEGSRFLIVGIECMSQDIRRIAS